MDPLSPLTCLLTLTFTANEIIKLVIILLCVFLAAFYAACETALSKCNYYVIEARSEDDNKKAKLALKILNKMDKSIVDLLVSINILHIVASMLATILFISLIPNEDVASLVSTIVMTLIVFFFSEMLPKQIASQNPDKIIEDVSYPLYITGIILFPISIIFRGFVKFTKFVFRVDDSENDLDEEDYKDVVSDIEEDGLLEEEESELLQNAIDFGDFTVKDVLTPANKMVSYNAAKSGRKEVLDFVKDVKYTRIPVYEDSKNNIIGVLHIKKYLLACKDNKRYFNFKSMLTKPLFVSETTKVDDMFDIFQENRCHIAFVRKDESDEILGMVTMEDVVEKLVGDIDEKNPPKVKLGGRKA